MDLQMKIDDEKYMTEVATRKKTQKESAINMILSLKNMGMDREQVFKAISSGFSKYISETGINKLVDKYMK